MQELEGPEPSPDKVSKADASRDRKFWAAIGGFGILAALIWFTLGEGTVLAFGRPVQIRLIPLFVVGMFVLRTWVAREADKVRQRSEDQRL
jgi:hypothetical protein